MTPRCPLCAGFAGTSRTVAGKRMWCTTPGCTWSAVVAEEELTGRDMCAVGQYIRGEGRDTARGCTWSAVVAEDALTGRDMCAVVS